MSVTLINGDGNPKVTASQDADWYGAMTGEKTAILPMNDGFEYSVLSNNLISIGSGVLVTREGRRVQIDNNDSIEIAIPSGAVGSNSYYIVGFRLYIDTDGTQKAEGFCQTMTSSTETITETAFKEGSSTVYVSLYRITKIGVDIDTVETLLPTFVGLDDKADQDDICSDFEETTTASKAYAVGKYFWNKLTGTLRRVTSAISQNASITTSNSTDTTVCDELYRINTDLSYKSTTSWSTAYNNAKNEIVVFWKATNENITFSVVIPKIEIGSSARTYESGGYYSAQSYFLATIDLSTTSASNAMLTKLGAIIPSTIVYYYR